MTKIWQNRERSQETEKGNHGKRLEENLTTQGQRDKLKEHKWQTRMVTRVWQNRKKNQDTERSNHNKRQQLEENENYTRPRR